MSKVEEEEPHERRRRGRWFLFENMGCYFGLKAEYDEGTYKWRNAVKNVIFYIVYKIKV